MTNKSMEGKVAIVFGAAGRDNMGQVIARRFANEGARVVVAGRNESELQRFASEIGGVAYVADITRKDDVTALFERASTLNGKGAVDVAVNATGWGLLKSLEETSVEELDQMTALQFKGPFYFCQAAVAHMKANGGSIIQISSATATIMLENHAAYMGTKAGTDHLLRTVANEYGQYGIRANSISPGLTDTPMTSAAKDIPGMFDAFLSCYPLGRIGTKEDIAAAAVWLSSDECFMTGQNMQVNGGLTLRRNPTNAEIQASIAKATQE
jgi:NAD(P)-dependent dehydrogenase (short-subunit alcohol dehydrogenase family)